jgi:hypothetical protein
MGASVAVAPLHRAAEPPLENTVPGVSGRRTCPVVVRFGGGESARRRVTPGLVRAAVKPIRRRARRGSAHHGRQHALAA